MSSSFATGLGRSYSIISSARASSVGGTSKPSAFAVLWLIVSSYLVGACTASRDSALNLAGVLRIDRRQFHAERRRHRLNRRKLGNPGG